MRPHWLKSRESEERRAGGRAAGGLEHDVSQQEEPIAGISEKW